MGGGRRVGGGGEVGACYWVSGEVMDFGLKGMSVNK